VAYYKSFMNAKNNIFSICCKKKVKEYIIFSRVKFINLKSLDLDPDTDSMKIGLDPDPVQCIWIFNTGITIANTVHRYNNYKSRSGGTHCFFDPRILDAEEFFPGSPI
jgi:hypothetical protein